MALVGQAVEYASIAINLLANTYAPETVLLSGSMVRQNPIFATLVERSYRDKLNDYYAEHLSCGRRASASAVTSLGAGLWPWAGCWTVCAGEWGGICLNALIWGTGLWPGSTAPACPGQACGSAR